MKVIVNDILLNHIESGHPHGVPVVFIHGFPFNHTMWEPQLENLPIHYRLIAYDIRGLGKSDLGNGEKTLDQHAEDLIGLLDDLQIDKAIICGLSMGGYIALRAIEKHPERFLGLVLCDTKSESDTEEGRQKRFDTIERIRKNGVHAFAEEFPKVVLSQKTLESNPSLVKALQHQILENSSEGIISAQSAMAYRSDTTPVLKKIKVPTLILVGEDDQVAPVKVGEAMKDKIPNARLEVIPGAGHISNMENPQGFNKKLTEFLSVFQMNKS